LKEELLELEKCLIRAKNPILPYLNSGTPFDIEKFNAELNVLNMKPTQDMIALYNWKSGLPEQTWDFNLELFSGGTFIHYLDTISTYKIVLEYEGTEFYKLLPIILRPFIGSEDPVMINLDETSSTYGSILYYSAKSTPFGPALVYDSLHSLIQTIIECYHQNVYTFDVNGELLYNDTEKINNIRKKFNKKKSYWDVEDC
jgi:hypothetical protein